MYKIIKITTYVLFLLCLGSCGSLARFKTFNTHQICKLEGVHFTALYEVLGSPSIHDMDTISHKNYNYFSYNGNFSGSWQFQNAIFGYGIGYGCDTSVKTTKNGFIEGLWMTGTNCNFLIARICDVAKSYKKNPESLENYRLRDAEREH